MTQQLRRPIRCFGLSHLERSLTTTDPLDINLHTLHLKDIGKTREIDSIRKSLLKTPDTIFYYSLRTKNIHTLAIFFEVKLTELKLCLSSPSSYSYLASDICPTLTRTHFRQWFVKAFVNTQAISLEIETTVIKKDFIQEMGLYSRNYPGKLKDLTFECTDKTLEKMSYRVFDSFCNIKGTLRLVESRGWIRPTTFSKINLSSLELKVNLTSSNVASILHLKLGGCCKNLKLVSLVTSCDSRKFLPLFIKKSNTTFSAELKNARFSSKREFNLMLRSNRDIRDLRRLPNLYSKEEVAHLNRVHYGYV